MSFSTFVIIMFLMTVDKASSKAITFCEVDNAIAIHGECKVFLDSAVDLGIDQGSYNV